jgi:hypothetical protein
MKLPAFLNDRLVGERRAIALLAIGIFTFLFSLLALAQGGAWVPCFAALAIVYGFAFFGLAAEWFWARWFAMGIATSGMSMAALGVVTQGFNGALLFWGGVHALFYLPLLGDDMAERYELQSAWRKRYQLDEQAVLRIKRAVHSTATALPTLILYTLAPRQDQGAILLLLAASVGFFALLRMKTWSIVALATTAIALVISSIFAPVQVGGYGFGCAALQFSGWQLVTISAVALTLPAILFARPMARFLRR